MWHRINQGFVKLDSLRERCEEKGYKKASETLFWLHHILWAGVSKLSFTTELKNPYLKKVLDR
jgi:hypothetical protein